jgi:hypothetical protein
MQSADAQRLRRPFVPLVLPPEKSRLSVFPHEPESDPAAAWRLILGDGSCNDRALRALWALQTLGRAAAS